MASQQAEPPWPVPKLEHLAGANVSYELAKRAAEDWIVLRARNPDDGLLDHGKRINLGITRQHNTSGEKDISGPARLRNHLTAIA